MCRDHETHQNDKYNLVVPNLKSKFKFLAEVNIIHNSTRQPYLIDFIQVKNKN